MWIITIIPVGEWVKETEEVRGGLELEEEDDDDDDEGSRIAGNSCATYY